MGQAIAEFRVKRPSPGNTPLGEEEHKRINASLDQARNFLESRKNHSSTSVSL